MLPVFFRERVKIKTRLIKFDKATILMEGVMSDESETLVKSVVWINFIYFDLDKGKVISHSEELMRQWQNIWFGSPEAVISNFEGRLEQIRLASKNN